MDRSDQMAILVFAVNTFPLELAWYSEVCLFKELTWDWILRLQERGAGALRGSSLPAAVEVGSLSVTGPPQRSFLSCSMDLQ